MYFSRFPEMLYNFPIGGNDKVIVVRDITVNVRILKSVLENVSLYDTYDVVEGETPEIVSAKLYGSSEYHWALMIANQRFDYINDWPMTFSALERYCVDKYGDPGIYETHHYENAAGFVVNSSEANSTPISNFTVEDRLNETKRSIKIISKQVLEQIVNEFAKLV
jgi:hypothetical protein